MPRNTTRAEPGKRALTADDRSGALFVQSVEKAMNVLSAFHHSDGPLTLSEIAARAGLDRSAAQRMVHTLRTLGYIERDADGHGFVPGLRFSITRWITCASIRWFGRRRPSCKS